MRSHPIQGGGSGIVRRIAEHMGRAFLAGASPSRGCVASQRAAQFSRHLRAQRLLLLIRLLLLLLRLLLRLLLHGLRDSLQRIRTDWYRYWSSLRLNHKKADGKIHLTNIRWDNFVDNFQFFSLAKLSKKKQEKYHSKYETESSLQKLKNKYVWNKKGYFHSKKKIYIYTWLSSNWAVYPIFAYCCGLEINQKKKYRNQSVSKILSSFLFRIMFV